MVTSGFEFHCALELALFEKRFGDTDTTRIPNLNEGDFNQPASVLSEQ